MEAKYRSVATIAAKVRWICSLLTELGISLPHQPVIYYDNVGAINFWVNLVSVKHVALDYHFICKQVQSGLLKVAYVSSVDALT